MKTGPDRRYTTEFRDAAVKQVLDGERSIAAVARSLEMSSKSLANWVYRARKGQELTKRVPAQPASELEAEISRLRQENAKLRLEKESLKKAAAYLVDSTGRCNTGLRGGPGEMTPETNKLVSTTKRSTGMPPIKRLISRGAPGAPLGSRLRLRPRSPALDSMRRATPVRQ